MDSKNDDFQKNVYILPSKIILESRASSETTEFQTTSKYRDLAKDYCGLYPLHPISKLVLGKKFQQKGKMLQNLAYYCPLLEFFIEHKPRNWKSAVPTEGKRYLQGVLEIRRFTLREL